MELPQKLNLRRLYDARMMPEEVARRQKYDRNELFISLADYIPDDTPVVLTVTVKREIIPDLPNFWPESGCTEITTTAMLTAPE